MLLFAARGERREGEAAHLDDRRDDVAAQRHFDPHRLERPQPLEHERIVRHGTRELRARALRALARDELRVRRREVHAGRGDDEAQRDARDAVAARVDDDNDLALAVEVDRVGLVGRDDDGLVVGREEERGLLARRGRDDARVGREVACRGRAVRVLEDDAREAELGELEGEAAGDRGLRDEGAVSSSSTRSTNRGRETHRAEDGDGRRTGSQNARAAREPDLLAGGGSELEPDLVDADLLRCSMLYVSSRRPRRLRRRRRRRRTQGKTLRTDTTAVMPSSSGARAPLSSLSVISNVGNATAAKSA